MSCKGQCPRMDTQANEEGQQRQKNKQRDKKKAENQTGDNSGRKKKKQPPKSRSMVRGLSIAIQDEPLHQPRQFTMYLQISLDLCQDFLSTTYELLHGFRDQFGSLSRFSFNYLMSYSSNFYNFLIWSFLFQRSSMIFLDCELINSLSGPITVEISDNSRKRLSDPMVGTHTMPNYDYNSGIIERER